MTGSQTSVIIVSWNVRELLRVCLKALERERRVSQIEVIVVDNASLDNTATLVRQEFPWVKFIAQPTNLGFAKACNQAAKLATGRYFVFLNPDTEVSAGFFNDLEREFARHARVGILGGHLLRPDGSTQPSVRGLPTPWPMVLETLKLLQRFPWLAPSYLRLSFNYETSQFVEQVMGACFAVRRETWEQLNGFDERFFVWFEEVDFCKRALTQGYEIWYSAHLILIHQQGQSFNQLTYAKRHRLFTQSLLWYARKHFGLLLWSLLWPLSGLWLLPAYALDLLVQHVKRQT